MTNKEYFEKSKISFAEVIKEYNVMKHGSFEQFLYAERHFEHKFNVGDVLIKKGGDSWTIVIYDIFRGEYLYVYKGHNTEVFSTNSCDISYIDEMYMKIGHSDLQFAVKLGLIEDEDISREISEYE